MGFLIQTMKRSLSQLRRSPAAPSVFLLVSVFIFLFCLERRYSPSSNWVLFFLAAWVSIKYGRDRRKLVIEEIDKKKRWHMENTQPLTPLEPCEWLNKLLINTWPNYLEPKLSHKFATRMMKLFKSSKLKFIESLELEEFSLGLAPPAVGLQCTYWTTEENERVLHTGFHWDTNEMSILMAITIAGPFKWRAFLAVTRLHIKGDLRVVPILDGRCALFSFESAPKLQIGISVGGDSATGRMMEIPGLSFLVEKIVLSVLLKKMVEPNRSCLSFPAVDLHKHSSGAVLSVRIVSGIMLRANGCIVTKEENQTEDVDDKNRFVEAKLGRVARRTRCSKRGDLSPTWDETFEMLLDGSTGSIYFDVLTQRPGCSELLSLGQCRVKVMYVNDDSAVFWAIGRNNSVVAARCNNPGEFAELTVPLEQNTNAKIHLRLAVKEWKFDDDENESSHGILGSLSSFKTTTGRTIKVEVKEGRNIVRKDEDGNCDPYVLLQYGKTVRKTKTIQRNIFPVWNQTFEFAEISGGEYLKIKCFDADWVIDEIIGTARINLEGLEVDVARDIWVPLESMNTAEVRLAIKAIESHSSLGSSQNATSVNGILELVVLEARDLVAADFSGTSDPFVSVHYGKQKRRTKVIYKNLNPQWHQTLEFPDNGETLELHVKDHNVLLPTSNIGHCSVDYKHLPPNQALDAWLPLLGVRRGEIHIQITRRFHASETSPHLQPANIKSLLAEISLKMSSCLKEAVQLAEDDEKKHLCEKIAKIELLGNDQENHILQVLREKEMLLSKISELEEVMESLKSTDSDWTGQSI